MKWRAGARQEAPLIGGGRSHIYLPYISLFKAICVSDEQIDPFTRVMVLS